MTGEGGLAAFIAANLPLAPARAVSEIRLHLAGPATGLWRLGSDLSPYWAYQWGGGTALARYVLDRPHVVAGRRVLDLGCGGGIVAIAAALAGARAVSAVDIDPLAVVATKLNAAANEVVVSASVADVLAGPPTDVDLVLAGDVFYDPDLAGRMTAFLGRCRAAGICVLVGDAYRAPLPLARLRVVAEVPVPDFGGALLRAGAVFSWD